MTNSSVKIQWEHYNKQIELIQKGIQIIEEAIMEVYLQIEGYLFNVFNSQSTINRLLPYYTIGFDSGTNKGYIMFNGVIVKEFEVDLPKVECGIDGVKVNGGLIE